MQWAIENWLLLVGCGMVAMHVFGQGHGHKGGNKSVRHSSEKKTEALRPSKENTDA